MKFSSLNAHIRSFKQSIVRGYKTTFNKLKTVDSAEMKGE